MKRFNFFLLAMFAWPVWAALPLPPKAARGKLVNDLPPPYNLQIVVKNHSVALQWRWRPPEEQPLFINFGYEILRQDGANFIVREPAYADLDLHEDTYTYKVRVRGESKEHGGIVSHVSSWSEPVGTQIVSTCEAAARIQLNVQAAQKSYGSVSSVRMHVTGRIITPPGCTSQNATYHVDAETGASHAGPLKMSGDGRFDEFVDALGPDDEVPEGQTTFTVTVSADDEAGPATSDAYAVSLQLQNKFAPEGQSHF